MALLFCDGMDAYSVAGDLTRKGWQGTPFNASISSSFTIATTAGAYGGTALALLGVANSTGIGRWNTFTYSAGYTLNIGLLVKQTGFPSGNLPSTNYNGGWIGLGYSGAANDYVTAILSVQTNGHLAAYATDKVTPLGVGTQNVCDGNWHWVEMQMVFSTTATGSVKVFVDGVQQINVTNVITVTDEVPDGSVVFSSGSNNGSSQCNNWFDDIIVWDTSGTAFNTFPIGQQRITTLNPSAAGGSTQFTPSAGANYAVAAQTYAGTATLTSTTAGQTDLYANSGMGGFTPASISAVVTNVYASNPAGTGSFTVVPKLESSGTTVSGTPLPLTTTGQTAQGIFYKDSTGAAWTASSVNAAQIGTGD